MTEKLPKIEELTKTLYIGEDRSGDDNNKFMAKRWYRSRIRPLYKEIEELKNEIQVKDKTWAHSANLHLETIDRLRRENRKLKDTLVKERGESINQAGIIGKLKRLNIDKNREVKSLKNEIAEWKHFEKE